MTEQELGRDEVVSLAGDAENGVRDGRHTGGDGEHRQRTGDVLDLLLQMLDSGIRDPRIHVSRPLAQERLLCLFRRLELERDRVVHRHMQGAVRVFLEKRSVDSPRGEAGTPAHEIEEIHLVALSKHGVGELLTRHELAVELHAHHVGLLNLIAHQEVRDIESGLDLLRCTVDLDLHTLPLTLSWL